MASVKEDAYPRASLRPRPSERHGRKLGARSAAIVVAGAALAGLALVGAGCGGSSGEGVAQVETTTQATTDDSSSSPDSTPADPTAYSRCMRENGVPNFPDPKPNDEGGLTISPGEADFDPSSPQFKAAERACERYVPRRDGGGSLSAEERERRFGVALAYAACMRENGVPGFPDPVHTAEGDIGVDPSEAQFDPRTPQFKKAEDACRDLLPAGVRSGKELFGG
jgi:hypothetical protein